jgi:hypothetical protein
MSLIVFDRQNAKFRLMDLVVLIELGCDVTLWGWIRSISRASFDCWTFQVTPCGSVHQIGQLCIVFEETK